MGVASAGKCVYSSERMSHLSKDPLDRAVGFSVLYDFAVDNILMALEVVRERATCADDKGDN